MLQLLQFAELNLGCSAVCACLGIVGFGTPVKLLLSPLSQPVLSCIRSRPRCDCAHQFEN